MGLISRVSSRTYRNNKMNSRAILANGRRFLNSQATGGIIKGSFINEGYYFLRGNPIHKKIEMFYPKKSLPMWMRYPLIASIPVNTALTYIILDNEEGINAFFGTNQTTGCYSIAYWWVVVPAAVGAAFGF